MIKKILKTYLWLLPFLLFFTTFFLCFIFFSQENRVVPSILYLSSSQALEKLAPQQLNCRLLKEQESNWPAGTVIAQSPQPGKYIKPFQTVFITLSKLPATSSIPNAIGLTQEQIKNIFNSSYKIRYYSIYSSDLENRCIAQINHKEEIILYMASNQNNWVIMPSFYNKEVDECRIFLKKYSLNPTLFHTHTVHTKHNCKYCKITDQSPKPGTLISLANPPIIQLKI